MDEQYQLLLSSDFCHTNHPDNHGGMFINDLNQTMYFNNPGEKWSIAVKDVFYIPNSWFNI